MDLSDSMMGGMRELEKTPKADLHASFAAIRLQRASLRKTAYRDDSAEAKDARNSVLKFAEMLEETDLLDYEVKLRNETCERMSGSSAAGSGVYPARLFGEQNSHQNSHHLPLKHPKMV